MPSCIGIGACQVGDERGHIPASSCEVAFVKRPFPCTQTLIGASFNPLNSNKFLHQELTGLCRRISSVPQLGCQQHGIHICLNESAFVSNLKLNNKRRCATHVFTRAESRMLIQFVGRTTHSDSFTGFDGAMWPRNQSVTTAVSLNVSMARHSDSYKL